MQIHPDLLQPFSRTRWCSNTRSTHLLAQAKAGHLQSYHLLLLLFYDPSLPFPDTTLVAKLDRNTFPWCWILNVEVICRHLFPLLFWQKLSQPDGLQELQESGWTWNFLVIFLFQSASFFFPGLNFLSRQELTLTHTFMRFLPSWRGFWGWQDSWAKSAKDDAARS